MDKDVHPLGEFISSSNPFCFRVVREFRGSICFFQVQSSRSIRERASQWWSGAGGARQTAPGAGALPVQKRSTLDGASNQRPSPYLPNSPLPYGSTNTGRPTQTRYAKYSAFQFARRKQPCDSARPTCSGRGVP